MLEQKLLQLCTVWQYTLHCHGARCWPGTSMLQYNLCIL